MEKGARILIVDDDENMRSALTEALTRCGFAVASANNGKTAVSKLEAESYRLVVSDVRMPEKNGLELLEYVKSNYPKIGVILVTAYGTIETAVEAMKKGADDYLLKPFSSDALEKSVRRALAPQTSATARAAYVAPTRAAYAATTGVAHAAPTRAACAAPTEAARSTRIEREIITDNEGVKKILNMAKKTANSTASVLIQGESGTGKELVARYIHNKSNRAEKPFVAINCAALPEGLLESELFGHEKGAFTGAIARKIGKFELADGGTILLDEITEMNPALQAKLLRVLQEKEVDRVGGTSPVPVNVRIIATTNRRIEDSIDGGGFREDLYFRLNVIPIIIPPLRERMDDLPMLVDYFIKKNSERSGAGVKSISKEALSILVKCKFRGNVRELENVIERAVLLGEADTIMPQDLFPAYKSETKKTAEEGEFKFRGTVDEMERELILGTLERLDSNRTHAASELGISIRTLRNKLKAYKSKDGT